MMNGEDRRNREEEQRRIELLEARRLAADLRTSEKPRWKQLRARLEVEGVAVEDALIGDLGVEGAGLESGIVVAKDGRAFRFDFTFSDEAGDQIAYEDARVTELIEENEANRELYRRYWIELDNALSDDQD